MLSPKSKVYSLKCTVNACYACAKYIIKGITTSPIMIPNDTMDAAYSLSSFSMDANIMELNPTGADDPISTIVLISPSNPRT